MTSHCKARLLLAILEESSDFTIAGFGDQVLYQGTPCVVLASFVLNRSLLGHVFRLEQELLVDGFLARLEEREPRVVDLRVKEFCNDSVDETHNSLLVCFDVHKLWVVHFKDDFHLDSDGEQDHRHYKSSETFSLGRISHFQLRRALRDRDKQLLQVVLVEWHLVDVAKDAPIDEMTNEACESGDPVTLDLFEGDVNMLRGDLIRRIVQCLLEMDGSRASPVARPHC